MLPSGLDEHPEASPLPAQSVDQRIVFFNTHNTFDGHVAPLHVAAHDEIPKPDANGTPTGPRLVLPKDVLRQLTEPLLRVVQYRAEGRSMEWIMAVEHRSREAIRSRFKKVNRLLGTQTIFQAYRILLLAEVIDLR